MGLSDDERRVLEEMERHLRSASNDVVDLTPSRRVNPASITVGVLAIVAGISILLSGIVFRIPLVGVLGFIVMVIGVLVATRRNGGPRVSTGAPKPRSSTFEDRWERRMGGEL